nr:hypothetical protein [Volvox reticuliferus]BCL66228.1 hypothetical protein [Volvox reticuliferus]
MAMQADLEEIMGVHTHDDDVDADMHDIFFLLNSGPDSDGVSEPHAEAFDSSVTQQDVSQQPDCSPEVFCLSGMIPVPCGISGLKIKQEPPDAFGHVDVCESSRACTSSSGGSDFTNTAPPVGSPIHAQSPSFFGSTMDVQLAPSTTGQGHYCHHVLPNLDSEPLSAAMTTAAATRTPATVMATATAAAAAAATALAVAQAALSESKPDDVLATTQSDSTDALYDMVQSKSSRSYGRSSAKKPPLSHSTIEKHRRDRINQLIEELGEMVAPLDPRYRCEGAESAGLKRPKHAVLADVVVRYRQLQAENESLRRQLTIAGLPPGGSGSGSGSSSASECASGYGAATTPPQHRQSPPAVMQSTPMATTTTARVVSASAPVNATTTSHTNAVHAAADAAVSNPNVAATSPASNQSQVPSKPALQEISCPNTGATADAAATAAASVAASMPTPSVSPAASMGVHNPAVSATAVSSLLSHAAVGAASSAQLQAALNFPLIKAAAAAAAAAAVAAPLPGFVPVSARGGSSTAAASAGTHGIYGAAASATATSTNKGQMSVPSVLMVPPLAAVMPPPPLCQTEAAPPACNTAALAAPAPSHSMGGLSCPSECTTGPLTVQPSMHHAVADAQNNSAAMTAPAAVHLPLTASPSLDLPSDVTDSGSTEIHVCSSNALKCKLSTVNANAAATAALSSSPAAAFGAPCAHHPNLISQDSGNLCLQQQSRRNPQRRASPSSSSPLAPQRPSSSIAPMPPAATAAGDAAAVTTSSWLVRVVCPPRKDLVPAACSALAEAGVSLRSARVTSAPGGRMALELEVSCEEGVMPRGMQVGHIQWAIHSALQASATSAAGAVADGDQEQDGGDDGRDEPVAAAAAAQLLTHGRPAVSTRGVCKKKRQRTWDGQHGGCGVDTQMLC